MRVEFLTPQDISRRFTDGDLDWKLAPWSRARLTRGFLWWRKYAMVHRTAAGRHNTNWAYDGTGKYCGDRINRLIEKARRAAIAEDEQSREWKRFSQGVA